MMLLILAFIFGTMVGSFLNVCVYRIPEGQSIVLPASHCRACKKPIAFYDNIPLVSFLVLKGKCRHCGTPLSFQYPVHQQHCLLWTQVPMRKNRPGVQVVDGLAVSATRHL